MKIGDLVFRPSRFRERTSVGVLVEIMDGDVFGADRLCKVLWSYSMKPSIAFLSSLKKANS
jgi:hypothetical protein